jgi:hypothetical protein
MAPTSQQAKKPQTKKPQTQPPTAWLQAFYSLAACEPTASQTAALDLRVMSRPALLDQSPDCVADGAKAGPFYAVGDKTTPWSYVLTDDLAAAIDKAATSCGADINHQSSAIKWRGGMARKTKAR